MRRADRLFKLVMLLRRRRVVRAQDLARELEVSERTIYRDIQALSLGGVPVEGEAGVGYMLRRDFDLPPLMFTADEARALLLGARMVQAWGDPELEDAARAALDKIVSVATPEIRDALEEDTIQVMGFHMPADTKENLGRVRRSIEASRKLRFDYTRADGTESNRCVLPLGIFQWGQVWLLAAWCELRVGYRTFRIDRMAEIEILDAAFSRNGDKTLTGYLNAVQECEGS